MTHKTNEREFTPDEQQQMYAMLERTSEVLHRLKIRGVLASQTFAQIQAVDLCMDIRALIIDLDSVPDAAGEGES